MSSVAERLAAIQGRIAAACARAGRDPGEVVLVGASKQQPVDLLLEAHHAGLAVFGENRVQEAAAKAERMPPETVWHLLGPLQSNKARAAVSLFDTIHSVDRTKIARVLAREAEAAGRRIDCFLEINLGDEASKHGFRPEELRTALAELAPLTALRWIGLMAIPPWEDAPEAARTWFRKLAALRDSVRQARGWEEFPGCLSMGMSDDFEVAVEEGATHVRVGTALFGPRGERA